MKRTGWLAAGLIVAAGLGLRADQATDQAAPNLQTPTFKVQVEYVEVEANVTDDQGAFVRGLTAKDFQVFEDGKKQSIVNFSLVDIPVERYDRPLYAAQPIEPDVKSNAEPFEGRIYVMVIDDLHTDFSRTNRVKLAAHEFIERRLGQNDLMAVVHTAGPDDANQEFTNNKRLLLQAVDRTAGRKVQSATLSRNDDFFASGGLHADDPDEAERAYNARTTMQVLENVAQWFGSVRGRRKAILFVSEGVDYDLTNVIGAIDQPNAWTSPVYDQVQDTIRAAARSHISIYGIDPRGLTNLGDEDIAVSSYAADASQPTSLDQAQSIDAPQVADGSGIGRGSMQTELRAAQDSLRVLSDETGGFAVVNRNDFATAFERVVADNSSYYVLAYYPQGNKRDGKFHRIEVKMTRPGLHVRARRGYLLPKAKADTARPDRNAPSSPEVRDALASPLPISDGLTMRVFAAPFKGTAPNASVLVTAEMRGRDVHTDPNDALELTYAALTVKGSIADGKTDTVRMTNLRPETKARVAQTGVRFLNRLSLPPGRYQLRFAARDSASGGVGSVLYDLEVPDFSKAPLSMSGLVLTSAWGSQWATVRADDQLRQVLPGPPIALRQFPQNDEIALFTEVYDNQAASPHKVDILTTVTSDDGKVLIKAEDERDSAELGGANGGYGYTARVPLASLAPGAYVLTVEARSRLGDGATARRQTEFTVTPAAAPIGAAPQARAAGAGSAAPARNEAAMRTVARGVASRVDDARQVVARTDAEWNAVWRAHDADHPAPAVDFAREMVVGVFSGSRPTAGYGVAITGVREEGDTLVVSYRESRPIPGGITAQVLTSPFHLVAVPRHAGDVKFERVN
jgi:VWFA-related protein